MNKRIIEPGKLNVNPFQLIDKKWFLLTAGQPDSFNTMTASWGFLGVIWNLYVAVVFVRPSRFTFRFIENSSAFTLSFFPESYRSVLNFCGKYSGKEVNKVEKTGLLPVSDENGFIWFSQAEMVFKCKKIYSAPLLPENFIDPHIEAHYPKKDYHTQFIGEIIECLIAE